ncbi:MAG: ATP-binding cassette domain-containing protein [Parachlamydiales bacterium]|nr:ATP-binding cassette domain-containing protein [Parachlamydiales bacterium]
MDDMLDSFLNENGQEVDPSTKPRLTLHGRNEVYFLKEGRVDLFAVEMRNNPMSSPHILIAEIHAPALIFAFPHIIVNAKHIIQLATQTSTRLLKLHLDQLQFFLSEHPEKKSVLNHYVSQWIAYLSQVIDKTTADNSLHWIKPGQSHALKPLDKISPKINTDHLDSVTWIKTTSGKLVYEGNPEIPLSPFHIFPLAPHTILSCFKNSSVTTVDIDTVFYEKNWVKGLTLFHETLLTYLEVTQKKKDNEKLLRLTHKKNQEDETLDLALRALSSTLNKSSSKKISSQNIYSKIFQRIAEQSNLALPKRDDLKFSDTNLNINYWCRLYNLRNRFVYLNDDWWRNDGGTLLAFYGTQHIPCLLLNETGHTYTIYHPIAETNETVTEPIAKNLSSHAYSIYTPLPQNIRSGKDLLFYILKKFKKPITKIFLITTALAIISIIPFIVVQWLFNVAIPGKDIDFFFQLCLILLLSAITSSLFMFARSLSIVRLQALGSSFIKSSLIDRLLKLPVSFFRRFSAGQFVYRINAVDQMRSILNGHAIRLILSGVFSVFFLLVMFIYSPELSIISVLLFGVFGAVFVLCFFKKRRINQLFNALQGEISESLMQVVGGVAKLRVIGAEKRVFAHWAKHFAKQCKLSFKLQSIQNTVSISNNLLIPLSLACIFTGFMFMNHEKMDSNLSIGNFLAFYMALGAFSAAIIDFSNILLSLVQAIPLWQSTKVFLEEPLETSENQLPLTHFSGKITVESVSFRYSDESSLILDTVSIHAKQKELIALVGPSSCGKSTLVNLLLGFETPEKGSIYFDNHDLKNLDLRDVRRHIGIVLQDDSLINGTLYDNIACGRSYSNDAVMKAIELANFTNDLKNLPMGLHTVIQADNQTLSKGQRQKIFIARALVSQPKLLIFDEATSALDNLTQDVISKNIEQLDVTRIVIAHRLNTIKNADRIYVMDQGKIIDTGTYQELLRKPGLFALLAKRQTL